MTDKPTLFSESYNDLIDKPTLFSESFNDLADTPNVLWNESGNNISYTIVDVNLFKYTNANIPTSGVYNDLNVNGGMMLLDKDLTNYRRIYGVVEPKEVAPSTTTFESSGAANPSKEFGHAFPNVYDETDYT